MYQIRTCRLFRVIGSGFFLCWWAFVAVMVVTSQKTGPVAYGIAYGFLAIGSLAVVSVLLRVKREKFLVTDTTITQYFVFAAPRTYQIREITKVVVHRTRSTSFRIYIGKKKIFTLHDGMTNCELFLSTLKNNHVPFKTSTF